jgi:hypothetical protein
VAAQVEEEGKLIIMSYIAYGADNLQTAGETGINAGSLAEQACMGAGLVWNPVTGECVSSSVITPEQTCKNAGMIWTGSTCVDPLAGKTKPGTAPLEPSGPGTPGWVSGGGGGAPAPAVSEATAKAAMPWLIGAAVGVGVLALIATAASKKKPAGKTAHAVANRIMRSL